MKKFLAILLAALMLLGMLTACQNEENPVQTTTEATEATKPEQPAEEKEYLRVLTLGNSHTVDANLLLYAVFKKEMPEQKLLLGNMYYSGCSVGQHVNHYENNKAVYVYYKNNGGGWEQKRETTLEYALQEQAWDIIILHEMNTATATESVYNNDNYQKLIDYVKEKTVYAPKFIYNLGWANPTSQTLWDQGYPGNWVGSYEENWNADYVTMFTKMTELVQKYVTPMKDISGMIPTGTAFCYARNELGKTDEELYRDYTHVTDYGSLLAAYVWYAVITEQTELSAVNIDVIPARQRYEKNWGKGDWHIEQNVKDEILKSVNFALKNPVTVTPVK